jgi:Ca2+/Na+ antiporter
MMLQAIERAFGQAMQDRRQGQVRSAAPIVAGAVLVSLSVIFGSIALSALRGHPISREFEEERGFITIYSSLMLAGAGFWAGTVAAFVDADRRQHRWVWWVLAAGFLFLAFDELAEFHERVGTWLNRWGNPGGFRSWNDVIVIGYGVVAVPLAAWLSSRLLRWPWVMEMFAVATAFYLMHTFVDSVSQPPTEMSMVLEESFKILCGTFLMLGALLGLVGTLHREHEQTRPRQGTARSDARQRTPSD